MNKRTGNRVLSILLSASMLVSSLVCGDTRVTAETVTQIDNAYLAEDLRPYKEDGDLLLSMDEKDLRIIGEDINARGLYAKDFMLERNMHLAAVYPEAVHFEKEGKLEEINNSLQLVEGKEGEKHYKNKANSVQMQFPSVFGSGAMEISYKDSSLFFALEGSITGDISKSTENWEEVQNVEAVISNDTFTKEELEQMTERMRTILPKHLSSSATYQEIFPGVDAVYALGSTGVKENIVINERQDDTLSFCYTINAGEQSLKLQDDGSITAYDAGGKESFGISAPYVMDADGDVSFEVGVSLEEGSWEMVLGKDTAEKAAASSETEISNDNVEKEKKQKTVWMRMRRPPIRKKVLLPMRIQTTPQLLNQP